MNNNRLIIILLIFSLALNIGIISYLIYEHNSHNSMDKFMTSKKFKEMRKRMMEHSYYGRKRPSSGERRINFTKEERKRIREYFIKLHEELKPKIIEQKKLKKELYDSFQKGDIRKAKEILTVIHNNQKEIDIDVLSKTLNMIKEFPQEKRRFVSIMIFRMIGRRR